MGFVTFPLSPFEGTAVIIFCWSPFIGWELEVEGMLAVEEAVDSGEWGCQIRAISFRTSGTFPRHFPKQLSFCDRDTKLCGLS